MQTNAASLQASEEYIPLPNHLTKYCVIVYYYTPYAISFLKLLFVNTIHEKAVYIYTSIFGSNREDDITLGVLHCFFINNINMINT